MKKLLLIYIVLLFIVGCKSKEKKWDSIEFMLYGLKYCTQDDSILFPKYKIYCGYYIFIDSKGQSKFIYESDRFKNSISCFNIEIDSSRINKLLDKLVNLKPYTNIITDSFYLNDLFYMKIKINKGDSSKILSYNSRLKNNKDFFISFIQYVDSTVRYKNIKDSTINISLLKRRNEFMNYAIKMDTLNNPFPNLITPKIIFIPPKIVKHTNKHPKKD